MAKEDYAQALFGGGSFENACLSNPESVSKGLPPSLPN